MFGRGALKSRYDVGKPVPGFERSLRISDARFALGPQQIPGFLCNQFVRARLPLQKCGSTVIYLRWRNLATGALMRTASNAFALVLALAGLVAPALAQCPGHWLPADSMPGINGNVYATVVLPDGDLVAGGSFTIAGGVAANNIARWNGSSWSPIGSGLNPGVNASVAALAALPSGELIVGGDFTTADGLLVQHIARWNGTSWSAIGTGTNDSVSAIAVMPNGDVVAGGAFTVAGNNILNYVARWNGASWSSLGTGTSSGNGFSGYVHSLAALTNGDLVVSGDFTLAGGVAANHIAQWDGASWSALDIGLSSAAFVLTQLPGGDLLAGGEFTTFGGVARWNGSYNASSPRLGNREHRVRLFGPASRRRPSRRRETSCFRGTSTTTNIARWNGAQLGHRYPARPGPGRHGAAGVHAGQCAPERRFRRGGRFPRRRMVFWPATSHGGTTRVGSCAGWYHHHRSRRLNPCLPAPP